MDKFLGDYPDFVDFSRHAQVRVDIIHELGL